MNLQIRQQEIIYLEKNYVKINNKILTKILRILSTKDLNCQFLHTLMDQN